MLEILKNSKGAILNLFFKDADREYYLREIAKNLNKEPSYIQQSLNFLVKEGILQDERKGNLRFFKLNKSYPIYEEIKKIVSKTLGIEAQIKELVDNLTGAEYAFIFGSIAKGNEYSGSDIDLMLIGKDINEDYLIQKVNKLEYGLNREINYHIFSKEDVIDRLNKKESYFLNRILTEPKIILKGNLDEFTKFTKSN